MAAPPVATEGSSRAGCSDGLLTRVLHAWTSPHHGSPVTRENDSGRGAGTSGAHTLVFTVAMNGYRWTYRDCIASQAAWAERKGYRYAAVVRPLVLREPELAAWLKVSLLVRALEVGYGSVLFVDADARISASTPGLEALAGRRHTVQMARGRSGRLNSGVILVLRSPSATSYLEAVLSSAIEDIPVASRANVKYENANIIHIAQRSDAVGELPTAWNNTYDPDLDDHIRHFTGPLRGQHHPAPRDALVGKCYKLVTRRRRTTPPSRDAMFLERLDRVRMTAERRNPALRAAFADVVPPPN